MTTDEHSQDFEFIRDLIWERSGIYFESTKRQYFLRRIQSRMRLIGCHRLKDYYRILRYDSPKSEFSELLNLLTTTETYFFRNDPQLQSFEEEILPEILARKREMGQEYLHIWSAGCSSGEEPYTIGMLLQERFPDIAHWKVSIAATDINTHVLAKAREGVYTTRSLRETPPYYLEKYFIPEGEDYRIHDRIKHMVKFREGNLHNPDEFTLMRGVDCIFCRNVLIYFNIESCRSVIQMFYQTLATHGYLLLGHSESLYRISDIFTLTKLQHSLVYRKE